MEKVKVTEELLRDAFQKLSDELIEEWENIPDTDHKPSEDFEKKIKKLIGKTKNRELYKELLNIGKVAAAFIIIIGIALFSSTMKVKADPHLYFKKMEVLLNDASMYVYDEELNNYYLTLYEPTYVPEGYEEISRVVEDMGINIRYKNDLGKSITWKQRLIVNTAISSTDSEYSAEIETEYAGENISLNIYKDGYKRLYYETGNCVFKLNANDITVEDMYKMIEDMKKVEK